MDLVLIRMVVMGFNGSDLQYRLTGGLHFNQIGGVNLWTQFSMGCSQIHTVGIQRLQLDLILIRLEDMGFNGMFSDPHCN